MNSLLNDFIDVYTKKVNFDFHDEINVNTLTVHPRLTLKHEDFESAKQLDEYLLDLSFKLQNEVISKASDVKEPAKYIKTLSSSLNQLNLLFKEIEHDHTPYLIQNNIGIIKQHFLPGDHPENSQGHRKCKMENLISEDLGKLTHYCTIKKKYLDKIISVLHNLQSSFVTADYNHQKLQLNLSVSDVSLLFRLLKEEKLIEYKDETEVYRFIANNFSTKKAADISINTAKNHFLTPKFSSIELFKSLLTNFRTSLRKIEEKTTR